MSGLQHHIRAAHVFVLAMMLSHGTPHVANAQSEAASSAKIERVTTDGYLKQRPAWSPDGSSLLFARHEGSSIFLYLRSADGKTTRRFNDHHEPEYDAVYSPDGKRIAFTFVKTSPNQGDVDVHTINPDGKNAAPFAVTAGKLSHEESPTWSPDGKFIAFSSTRDGNQEIYIAPADAPATEPRRLTNIPSTDAHPAWSPDGKSIAFATDRWGDLEIALIDVKSGDVKRLTESRRLDDYPAWSPDGKAIAFTSNRDGNFEIYVMNADGSAPRNLTRQRGIDNFAAWHESGRITFVSNREGQFDIYIQKLSPEERTQ